MLDRLEGVQHKTHVSKHLSPASARETDLISHGPSRSPLQPFPQRPQCLICQPLLRELVGLQPELAPRKEKAKRLHVCTSIKAEAFDLVLMSPILPNWLYVKQSKYFIYDQPCFQRWDCDETQSTAVDYLISGNEIKKMNNLHMFH